MTHTCSKCRYTWRPRIDGTPCQCPRCKSTKWQGPSAPLPELIRAAERVVTSWEQGDLAEAVRDLDKVLNKYKGGN